MTMRTTIEFGGFYGSVHEGLVENAVEGFFGEDYADDEGFEPTWDTYYANYINEYTRNLSEWLADEHDVTVEFKKLSLDRPKYYNFETDKIIADLTKRDTMRLLAKFDKNIDFDTYLLDATQSYDGYISFYTYDEAKANKNDIKVQYLLSYLCNQFNEHDMYDYYDRNNSYERII
jgi:hypothetical protein